MNWYELLNPVGVATLLLALATAFLAIAAFWYIKENRRIRAEDKDGDSKRRALYEILGWAQDASSSLSVPRLDEHTVVEANMKENLKYIAARGPTAIADAGNLDVDLQEKVKMAVTTLGQFIVALEHAEKIADFTTLWENLKKYFLTVISSTSELRVDLRL